MRRRERDTYSVFLIRADQLKYKSAADLASTYSICQAGVVSQAEIEDPKSKNPDREKRSDRVSGSQRKSMGDTFLQAEGRIGARVRSRRSEEGSEGRVKGR